MIFLAVLSLLAAALPATVFALNLRRFKTLEDASAPAVPVSILIPARDEEQSISNCLRAVLADDSNDMEVIVLDDGSIDRTAALVLELAATDPRLRLEHAPPLPEHWCGKQFACATLADLASGELLLFIDADVRLAPGAVARLSTAMEQQGLDLLSGFPRQETITIVERMVIPLMHFILLGFLPLGRMRRSRHPAYAAGCGQLMMVRRSSYHRAGGHAAIRESLHDGLRLPRAFREAGLLTDLCDATDLAVCRMYRNAAEVIRGLAKNAVEGIAAPGLIVPATAVLLLGQVAPIVICVGALAAGSYPVFATALAALGASLLPRWMATRRFGQSRLGAVLHPIGVLLFVAIQWYACIRSLAGGSPRWKGREYPTRSAATGVPVAGETSGR
ncbi:MAG: glycosyltransferase [Planctomycetota bacterium]|nr:MAG: glycosyltransferase [Planctomycetota bacterium]